jgi:hypothetical protein
MDEASRQRMRKLAATRRRMTLRLKLVNNKKSQEAQHVAQSMATISQTKLMKTLEWDISRWHLPLLFTFLLFFLEKSLFETDSNGRPSILGRFRMTDHKIPAGEQFPRKGAFVFFVGQFGESAVLRHSVTPTGF